MARHLIAIASLCALLPLASCDSGGSGTLESCWGPYTGTFEVTMRGTPIKGRFLAYLGPLDMDDLPGQLIIRTMVDTAAPEPLQEVFPTTVDEEGGGVEGTGIMGNFDLEACEASGTMAAGDFLTDGTWRLTSDSTAY